MHFYEKRKIIIKAILSSLNQSKFFRAELIFRIPDSECTENFTFEYGISKLKGPNGLDDLSEKFGREGLHKASILNVEITYSNVKFSVHSE